MNVSHCTLPSARLTAISDRRRPRSRAVVTKICSPHTTGDELPDPGKAAFHCTREVGDHASV